MSHCFSAERQSNKLNVRGHAIDAPPQNTQPYARILDVHDDVQVAPIRLLVDLHCRVRDRFDFCSLRVLLQIKLLARRFYGGLEGIARMKLDGYCSTGNVVACVEINQCVGCSAMTRPSWFGRAVRNRHRHAIEQASRRWRGGRRGDSARTRRKILIFTQVVAREGIEQLVQEAKDELLHVRALDFMGSCALFRLVYRHNFRHVIEQAAS